MTQKPTLKKTDAEMDAVKKSMLTHLNRIVIEDQNNSLKKFKVTPENKPILQNIHKYLCRVDGPYDPRKGILFYGSVGSGKTLFLDMIKACLLDLWVKELTLFTAQYIKNRFYENEKEIEGYSMGYMVQNYRFLGINDIGLEAKTHSGDEIIRNVIYERYERKLMTFGTMNLTIQEFGKRYEFNDNVGRMADRFKHLFNYVKLTGDSFR